MYNIDIQGDLCNTHTHACCTCTCEHVHFKNRNLCISQCLDQHAKGERSSIDCDSYACDSSSFQDRSCPDSYFLRGMLTKSYPGMCTLCSLVSKEEADLSGCLIIPQPVYTDTSTVPATTNTTTKDPTPCSTLYKHCELQSPVHSPCALPDICYNVRKACRIVTSTTHSDACSSVPDPNLFATLSLLWAHDKCIFLITDHPKTGLLCIQQPLHQVHGRRSCMGGLDA